MMLINEEPKLITCSVCGATFPAKKKGVCVECPVIGPVIYWDYMDCPGCGCQIKLSKRLLDEHEVVKAVLNGDDLK